MLSQVQENCSYEESRLLDKVMDFLKKEGLYNPQMKELRTDDPVATDLIGALLMASENFEIKIFFFNLRVIFLVNSKVHRTRCPPDGVPMIPLPVALDENHPC